MKRHLVFFYWLLLLVSTLAIGGVTIYLLQRENVRLRTIAEANSVNTGLRIAKELNDLVTHAKNSSMDALGKPTMEPELLGNMWRSSLPYARSVFYYLPPEQATAGGRFGLLLPALQDPDRAQLEPLLRYRNGWIWDPNNRLIARVMNANFGTRFFPGTSFGRGVPPMTTGANGTLLPNDVGNSATNASNRTQPGQDGVLSLTINGAAGLSQVTVIQFSNGRSADLSSGLSDQLSQNLPDPSLQSLPQNLLAAQLDAIFKADTDPSLAYKPDQAWDMVGSRDNLRWLAWMRTASNGPVRGLLLSWEKLQNSMIGAFPDKLDPADGYILKNPANQPVIARFANGDMLAGQRGGDPVNDTSATPVLAPTRRLPVGVEMPGWTLEVYFNPHTRSSSNFMAIATVLVTVLVISMLVGGTLLLREARREAFDAARKTSFVSNVSHELKTPLTTIRMYAELLGEGRVRDQAKQHNYLSTIISESQRLTRLVNNVLDFSRLEQGRKQYHPADVSLGEVVRSVLEAQRPRLDEAGFQVEADLAGAADVHVHIDRDALEQVMLNLIDNALKYAVDGRWLGVRIAADAEHAFLTVSDHGPGVPADQREKIFETFHRVDDSITARLPGAGLGLSIARRLLRDQEGELRYEPNQPQGATFLASLPLAVSVKKDEPVPV